MIFTKNKPQLKHIHFSWIAILLLNCIQPFQANAEGKPVSSTRTANNTVQVLTDYNTARIAEINAMDKSALSRSEKKELRNELKAIRDRSDNGGIYLSVGAIIIIVLLLILLL